DLVPVEHGCVDQLGHVRLREQRERGPLDRGEPRQVVGARGTDDVTVGHSKTPNGSAYSTRPAWPSSAPGRRPSTMSASACVPWANTDVKPRGTAGTKPN